MNLDTIAKPNSKGQVVIPKKIRDELGIDEGTILKIAMRGRGLYLAPVDKTAQFSKESYLKVLRATAGSWGPASPQEIKKEKQQRKLELKTAQEAKKEW